MEFLPEVFDAMLSMGWLFLGCVALGHALKWAKDSDARFVERKRQERKQYEQMMKNVIENAKREGVGVRIEVSKND